MGDTPIEWTDVTWNPVRGCSRVSPGCDNCYAMRQAHRMDHPGRIDGNGAAPQRQVAAGAYHGLTTIRRGRVDWSGDVRIVPEALELPLQWRKPRRVFVNSMSDLFHEGIADRVLDHLFAVMALASQHTFQILTKRSERMRRYMEPDLSVPLSDCVEARVGRIARVIAADRGEAVNHPNWDIWWKWPLPNVWLGVSVEDQERADERVPELLETPATVRFVSAEPLLGPVSLAPYLLRRHKRDLLLDWVIVGGESGNYARPCRLEWITDVVDQCRKAGVACFVKQLGRDPYFTTGPAFFKHRKGGDPAEWPAELRVRQFPEVR